MRMIAPQHPENEDPGNATRSITGEPVPSAATLSFSQAAAAEDTRLGRRIENYHLIERIGMGGFGVVYKARDLKLDRMVAIKFLHAPLNRTHRDRFEREARMLANLSKHPGIVQIFTWGEDAGEPFFVLEYLEESGDSLLRKRATGLALDEVLKIACECVEALEFAHSEGVLHGDIKPENVLIDGRTGRAKLCDFGLSRMLRGDEAANDTVLRGSPPYIAPDQLEGHAPDARTDIYAFGVMMYRLLSGRLPFEGPTLQSVFERVRRDAATPIEAYRPDLPAAVREFVARAMARRPEDRFEDAAAMRGALARLCGAVEPARPRRRAWVPGIAAAAALVAIALTYFVTPLLREVRTGDSAPVALAAANQELEEGDYLQAGQIYAQYLTENPDADDARYGLGYALLLQGKPEEARHAFDLVAEKQLAVEGQAAVAHASEGASARTRLEEAAQTLPNGYPAVLLGSIDVLDGRYADAAKRLEAVDPNTFHFSWQRGQYLQTLGQAYFKQGDFEKAQRVFEELAHMGGHAVSRVAEDYVELSRQQQDSARREQVSGQLQRLRALMTEATAPAAPADTWTSRPLRLWIPPAHGKGQLAASSGLSDVLPWKIAKTLARQDTIPLEVVERDLIADILSEQELSRQLSPEGDALRLGQVLGARLIVELEFTTVFDREYLSVNLVDTETTRSIPVDEFAVTRDMDPEVWVDGLIASAWKAVQKAYPIRGRLTRTTGGARVNIGSAVGLREGDRLQVFAEPAASAPIAGYAAIVTAPVAAEEAAVGLEGFAEQDIPETGWYVQAAPRTDGAAQ